MNQELNIKLSERSLEKTRYYIADYWILKDETSEFFVLTKNEASLKIQLLILLFFGWWSFFIPNFVYLILMNKKIKIYKK